MTVGSGLVVVGRVNSQPSFSGEDMVRAIRYAATVALAAVAMLAGLAVPASARTAYAQPEVKYVSDVVVSANGGDAYVVALYRCYGGSAGTHVWVSAKQGPLVNTTDHSTSADAVSWYDTNWNPGPTGMGMLANCNGRWQVVKVDLKPETFFDGRGVSPRLVSGVGLVQFCLFDSTVPPGDEDPGPGFAFSYTMKHIFAL
jgi:hypothetical protein